MQEEAEKTLPEKLDAEMNKILPNWISGIITVNQMMLYPFLIIGIVIYMAIITFELTRHYRIMAKGLNISDATQSDAALSSLWTLTYRGRLGTFKTVAIYVGFVILMWYFYENGFVIFQKWQNAESNGLLNHTGLNIVLWAGRLILLALLIAIVKKPFDEKVHAET